ncbi:uncharacterized protein F5147DRAFT_780661 [Suillus discolor]|uniref:DUF8205 domain-containing protein n=1 Tax=Suillus discolor TaxID=1912936 RepID=A0A9P7JMS4_9AGAM|nr:uncharacterized protein F5147DRAFT_780661 [Suillus discolor]KAG2089334.1 hypothetical protein F5147DRAFT_780661 [Suillus discolor]
MIDIYWVLTPHGLDDRSNHKPACHQVAPSSAVERSPAVLKSIRMFSANPLLMEFLGIEIASHYDLFDDLQIGFDVPFVARVDIAMEPSNIFHFIGLYFNHMAVGEHLPGMLQVNAVTPWHSSLRGRLTPEQLHMWREARARHNAREDLGNSVTTELLIPAVVLDDARNRKPLFIHIIAIAGRQFYTPSSMTCLEYLNLYIRADVQNQLYLRAKMTKQDREAICATGRNEDTLLVRILRKKMEREHLYANIFTQNGQVQPRTRYGFYFFLVFLLGCLVWVVAT